MTKKSAKKTLSTSTKSSSLVLKLSQNKFRISFGIFIVLFSSYLHQSFKLSRHDSIDTNGLYSYWLDGNKTELEYKSLVKVLNEMGLKQITMTFKKNEDIHMDWHLSWTRGHQVDRSINFDKLKPYQKLNHFPGNDVLVSKRLLAAKVKSKYIPRAFDNVDDLRTFADLNPNQKFVYKTEAGISIKSIAEMDLEKSERRLVQEYIGNPLLLDGHKFDFGVFVAVTSIDPLRLYYYPENISLRFCEKPYNPFNASEITRYTSGGSGIIGADFPEIKKRLKGDKTVKRALEAHFKEKGIDINTVWSSVEESIRNVVIETEKYFVKEVRKYQMMGCIDDGVGFVMNSRQHVTIVTIGFGNETFTFFFPV
jgi:Tubulin-tyrosine ligase family